jgi:hypothetical protein
MEILMPTQAQNPTLLFLETQHAQGKLDPRSRLLLYKQRRALRLQNSGQPQMDSGASSRQLPPMSSTT